MNELNEKELRELDAWIAERVFGCKPVPIKIKAGRMAVRTVFLCRCFQKPHRCISDDGLDDSIPPYTTDPGPAFDVLVACYAKDRNSCLASFHNFLMRKDHDTTLTPLQVCLFALKLFKKEI